VDQKARQQRYQQQSQGHPLIGHLRHKSCSGSAQQVLQALDTQQGHAEHGRIHGKAVVVVMTTLPAWLQ
jgi:hypothetical protein